MQVSVIGSFREWLGSKPLDLGMPDLLRPFTSALTPLPQVEAPIPTKPGISAG